VSLKITDEEFQFFSTIVRVPDMVGRIEKTRSTYDFRTVHRIQKVNSERQNVFGWASVGYLPEKGMTGRYKEYEDWQGDILKSVEDIEDAAYDFTLNSRDSGTEHIGKGGKGTLIESFVSTPEKWDAMGIPHGVLPVAWWTGFHISDPDAWGGVKSGRFKMFSVQGQGRRIPL
jgi:Putative phage serine protease XkdF